MFKHQNFFKCLILIIFIISSKHRGEEEKEPAHPPLFARADRCIYKPKPEMTIMKPLRTLIAAYRGAYAGLPREVWLLAGALLVNRAGTMVSPFLSLYLTRDLDLTAANAGLIIGCFGLGTFLVCGGLAILPFGPGWMVAVLFMVVLTVGEMLSMPITNAVVAERAGVESVGRYMGVYTLAFSTAFVIGPIAGTAIYQNLGPQYLWCGVGAVGVALAIDFAALSRPLRTRS